MPVPISAQVYMPNPALGPQSYARGAEVGRTTSPFANFVSGALEGAQQASQTLDTIQRIQYRPEQMEREQRAADRADRAEARAQNAEDFNQRFDTQRLQLEREKFNHEKSVETERLLRQKNNATAARYGQVIKTEAEGVIAQAMGQGDFSGIIALTKDPNKKDVLYNVMDKLAEPNGYGPAFNQAAQQYITSGQARPDEIAALQNFSTNVGYAGGLRQANKQAASETEWIKTIGVAPDPRYPLRARETNGANGPVKEFYQLIPGEGEHMIGRYIPDGQNDQKVENMMAAHQYRFDTQRRMREKIMQPAIDRAAKLENQSRNTRQEDTPIKVNQSKGGRTPLSRTGLRSLESITDFDTQAKEIVDSDNRQKAKERAAKPNQTMIRARERIQNLANPQRQKEQAQALDNQRAAAPLMVMGE